MNWRTIQLGSDMCNQDHAILKLIGDRAVRIYGEHCGFDQFCRVDHDSDFCLIFFNQPLWLSEVQKRFADCLATSTKYLYVGLNRYQIKGNDILHHESSNTLSPGAEVLYWLQDYVTGLGFTVVKHHCFENDQGRFFNFVQPLTWIYAEK